MGQNVTVIYHSTTKSNTSLFSMTKESSNQSTHLTTLTDRRLHPETVIFKYRLNLQLDHLPEEIIGQNRCALH